ncbi:MAG TPA: tail fiber protein [Holophagaceae bacterium]|jgi:microcystin-dependent protein|nr:tail fiber protein [Holophagaceae bacterium]
MSTPFLGEIRITGFNFPPKGWAMCNGQLLAINQNQALFSILGTTYGGNGITTFALPDLRSRVPMHWGNGAGLSPRSLGEVGGEETVTLTSTQVPYHGHAMTVIAAAGTTNNPNGALLAQAKLASNSAQVNSFGPASGGEVALFPEVGSAGSGQPHTNLPPVQCLNYVIALSGIFPSRN